MLTNHHRKCKCNGANTLHRPHERKADDLKEIFSAYGISKESIKKNIITTCGSGMTACAIAFALHYIGLTHIAVYDGSWSEWGREDSGMSVTN